MRSFRSLIVAIAAILALTGLAASVTASTPHTLTITKECSKYTGANPSYCTITAANFGAIPAGTKVWYSGPVISSSVFTSSTAVLDDGQSNTATGYCQVDFRSGLGMCTFWKGTGTLAGFHAIVNVSVDSTGLWHWDGRYYFTGR